MASADVLAAAASFFPAADLWWFRVTANANEQDEAELERWSALPSPSTVAVAPVVYEISRYSGSSPSGPIGPHALITFERTGDGWSATEFRAGTLP